MARKKTASYQNEFIVSYKPDDITESVTIIGTDPTDVQQKFVAATSFDSSAITLISKTGELAII